MWVSVALETDAAHADALSDALLAAGAISVSVEDAQAGTDEETPQFGEPGGADVLDHHRDVLRRGHRHDPGVDADGSLDSAPDGALDGPRRPVRRGPAVSAEQRLHHAGAGS